MDARVKWIVGTAALAAFSGIAATLLLLPREAGRPPAPRRHRFETSVAGAAIPILPGLPTLALDDETTLYWSRINPGRLVAKRRSAPVWSYTSDDSNILSLPLLHRGSIVFAHAGKRRDERTGERYGGYDVVALHPATGHVRWRTARRFVRGLPMLIPFGDDIVELHPSQPRTIAALAVEDGSARWTNTLPWSTTLIRGGAGVVNDALYVSGMGGRSNHFYWAARLSASGELERLTPPDTSNGCVLGDAVAFLSIAGGLWLRARGDDRARLIAAPGPGFVSCGRRGQHWLIVWRRPGTDFEVVSRPPVPQRMNDSGVSLGSRGSALYVLDPADASVTAAYRFSDGSLEPFWSEPLSAELAHPIRLRLRVGDMLDWYHYSLDLETCHVAYVGERGLDSPAMSAPAP
jgi:hypothetical protein